MTYNPDIHHRHSVRLKDYDYSSAGAYFVTICAKNRECLFGEIADGSMQLNIFGANAKKCWNDLPEHYMHATLDACIIMPNHVHGIVVLTDENVGAGLKPAPTKTGKRHDLSEIIRAFKTFSSRRVNEFRKTPGIPLWQRNYYDHIIRDEDELNRIRQYILDNPLNWDIDEENPDKKQPGHA